MILVVDNYDSFTYNLVQALGALGADMRIVRNDELSVAECMALKPERIIISPGPCTPKEAGISVDLIKEASPSIPMLGVCLGHQSLVSAYGGNIIRADVLMHGKTSLVKHDFQGIFKGINSPFIATRYHSLIAEESSIPECFEITARDEDHNYIMAVRHKEFPSIGLQFHPESFLCDSGPALLKNFLDG